MAQLFEGTLLAPTGRFAVCVSRWNSPITEQLRAGAEDALVRHGVAEVDVHVFKVPGTFELPGLVRRLAESGRYLGVVALGCLIRGGTPHFEYLAAEVARGLGEVARTADCAVSFGVLTCDSVEQAVDRAGMKAGNKGAEAAMALLEMVNLYARLGTGKKK